MRHFPIDVETGDNVKDFFGVVDFIEFWCGSYSFEAAGVFVLFTFLDKSVDGRGVLTSVSDVLAAGLFVELKVKLILGGGLDPITDGFFGHVVEFGKFGISEVVHRGSY
jgi:hypothetical protein